MVFLLFFFFLLLNRVSMREWVDRSANWTMFFDIFPCHRTMSPKKNQINNIKGIGYMNESKQLNGIQYTHWNIALNGCVHKRDSSSVIYYVLLVNSLKTNQTINKMKKNNRLQKKGRSNKNGHKKKSVKGIWYFSLHLLSTYFRSERVDYFFFPVTTPFAASKWNEWMKFIERWKIDNSDVWFDSKHFSRPESVDIVTPNQIAGNIYILFYMVHRNKIQSCDIYLFIFFYTIFNQWAKGKKGQQSKMECCFWPINSMYE